MIEETSLLKRLAFKQTDTHWLTMWADWRDSAKHEIIVELVRREDRATIVNEIYDYSDLAMKHYSNLFKEMDVQKRTSATSI